MVSKAKLERQAAQRGLTIREITNGLYGYTLDALRGEQVVATVSHAGAIGEARELLLSAIQQADRSTICKLWCVEWPDHMTLDATDSRRNLPDGWRNDFGGMCDRTREVCK